MNYRINICLCVYKQIRLHTLRIYIHRIVIAIVINNSNDYSSLLNNNEFRIDFIFRIHLMNIRVTELLILVKILHRLKFDRGVST